MVAGVGSVSWGGRSSFATPMPFCSLWPPFSAAFSGKPSPTPLCGLCYFPVCPLSSFAWVLELVEGKACALVTGEAPH